ncbi:MAG: chlorophyll synthase ChlG [Rhodobacteraceae bacterium]|uniref:chlorophyll synthase ChlG n=1 Tax=Roseovarius sp. 10 TaxID=3080563 RepID=UPI001935A658|nr:chlorophyll synthase ChlG [Roseovarius sp. 10]MBE1289914.1 chlorophyll synthase ChlG [Paracoccaceae bacterium]MDV7202059.1 chlorophyll synthase ChlG [Roseovarius sp. 10]QPI84809.1 chlorophyll synthase ChlG [Rhodobacterales bacterium HKCCA1288]
MSVTTDTHTRQTPRAFPEPRAVLTLLKPITWFPPMWAYLCGAISTGMATSGHWLGLALGIILAGPIVCGMSQAANDWCDRHVDAINEPYRPIPSGRIPGKWGLWIAILMSGAAAIIGLALGPWGFGATLVAIAAAWAYSAEPVRLKRSGILGPGLVGLSYESLPWFTGAAVLSAGAPSWPIVITALLYGIGAHGIMTLNDFKALEGDRQMGVNSLPVTLGPRRAALVAAWVMAIPQFIVILLMFHWDRPWFGFFITASLLAQIAAMQVLMQNPKERAPWYNATGVSLYVSGMMIAAFGLRGLGG